MRRRREWTYLLGGRGEDADMSIRMRSKDPLAPEIISSVLGQQRLEVADVASGGGLTRFSSTATKTSHLHCVEVHDRISYQLSGPVIRDLSPPFRDEEFRSDILHLLLFRVQGIGSRRIVTAASSICGRMLFAKSHNGLG